jgi:glyoxylase-like metal-dependent hydrolase (beta-lactamase superfamily II)
MRLLPNARFTVSRTEWRAATARGAGGRGFVGHHLPDAACVDLVDIETVGEPHGPFSRTFDLLGDGSIRLVATPGHTPGHTSLLLRAAGGRTVLLVGDAAYTLRNVREGLLPLLTADDRAYRESLREIAAFAEGEPDATLVPSHDPDAWRELQP